MSDAMNFILLQFLINWHDSCVSYHIRYQVILIMLSL